MAITKKILIVFILTLIFMSAIFLAIFFLSFKTSYKDIVLNYASENNIDPALVFSIIKAESKFNKNAKSSAGAVGLMQVKLETANYMLSLDGENVICENDLYIPETNINLGTRYLSYLINKFENVDVAICAYNAGETIVRSWLNNQDYSKDGKTLSKIPFVETQNYLSKVNFNQKIYKIMLKEWLFSIIY